MNIKRYAPLAAFLIALSAPAHAEQARRFFEIGVDAAAGFANNLLGAEDILKKNIVIDLNKFADVREDGFWINAGLDTAAFINVAFGEKVTGSCKVNPGENGFGLSVGASGGVFANIPKSLLTFLGEGNINAHSPNGDFIAYGGVFADAEVDVHFKIAKKLRIGIVPAMYVPIIYIPKSSIHYRLEAEDALKFNTSGEINVYSPFSLEDLSNIAIDADSLLDAKGFDLSLNTSYDILSFLNIGADIIHIPLIPSHLKYQMNITGNIAVDGSELIAGGSLDIPNLDTVIQQNYASNASKSVMRPLRFDFYGRFHWGNKRFDWLSIRPNIGFTMLNPAEEFWFNAGLDLRLNLANILIFHIGTGYEETLWKHRAGFALNLRVFELDVEVGLQSQDFVKSFQLTGLQAGVGVRIGF
jgi:hypothetical protein